MTTNNDSVLSADATMWSCNGFLSSRDERYAFRYKVRDESGDVRGFINADRARSHPGVMWKLEIVQADGRLKKQVRKIQHSC